jgi:hypothetical protein
MSDDYAKLPDTIRDQFAALCTKIQLSAPLNKQRALALSFFHDALAELETAYRRGPHPEEILCGTPHRPMPGNTKKRRGPTLRKGPSQQPPIQRHSRDGLRPSGSVE